MFVEPCQSGCVRQEPAGLAAERRDRVGVPAPFDHRVRQLCAVGRECQPILRPGIVSELNRFAIGKQLYVNLISAKPPLFGTEERQHPAVRR
jgi:hypothetical protein